MKNLLIVESPAKAKTIQRYLGEDFVVLATLGHIFDLPKNRLGVDIEHDYNMEYKVLPGKRKVINSIRNVAAKSDAIYLAQDPDREGEAIAWQVQNLLKLKGNQKIYRSVFHEITKEAIKDAVKNPRTVNLNLVYAQQARRILDRLVGYLLSALLWKKIRYGLSAGRVQSAALRLIVERENQIKNFISKKFYHLKMRDTNGFDFFIAKSSKGTSFRKLKFKEDNAKSIFDILQRYKKFDIERVVDKDSIMNPPPPFITSTLQQEANRRFGYTAKFTMGLAQKLYQGVDIKGRGRIGLITYMRTDSVNLSKKAVNQIRKIIQEKFGSEYLSSNIRVYKNKAKNAQEAHEAIRPTYPELSPADLQGQLDDQLLKLYKIIWERTIATQMAPAIYKKTKIILAVNELPESMELSTVLLSLKHEGFLAVCKLKALATSKTSIKGDSIVPKVVKIEEHETTPPSRYTDATLVKEMERLGIGRPSTYATIIGTLILRQYIERRNKLLYPTDNGIVVSNFLVKYFPKIVDYNFTAEMETKLDKIASGQLSKKEMLDNFYPDFARDLKQKEASISKQEIVVLEQTDKKCPKCGAPMVLKLGRYGKFYSCSRFPDCDGMLPYIDEDKYLIPPEAKEGEFILKASKYGKFWAHKDYPKVKKTMPLLLKDKCPKCGAHLVERKSKKGRLFIGCSNYPNCDYIARP